MTDAEYHAIKDLSKSAIDLILECEALYKAWLESVDDEEKTKALEFGGMFHKLTLEPRDFDNAYAVTDFNLATKQGREWKESVADGVSIIKTPEYEQALLMAEAVRDHPQAKHLFKDYKAEVPIFWTRPDGIKCKAKPDIISNIGDVRVCADLKSTESVNPREIQRTIAKYHYYRQAPWYLDGLEAVGQKCTAFIFIFVEKSYPHLVTLVQLDEEAIQQGRNDCEKAVQALLNCQKTGEYPCYTRDILTIGLPRWAVQAGE